MPAARAHWTTDTGYVLPAGICTLNGKARSRYDYFGVHLRLGASWREGTPFARRTNAEMGGHPLLPGGHILPTPSF